MGLAHGISRDGDEDRPAGVQEDGESAPDYISSDCALAAHHIAQGIESLTADGKAGKSPITAHPLTLVRIAYGLPDSES